MNFGDFVARARKAFIAGGGAAVTAAVAAVKDHGGIKTADAVIIVGSAIVFGFLAFIVPNATAEQLAARREARAFKRAQRKSF